MFCLERRVGWKGDRPSPAIYRDRLRALARATGPPPRFRPTEDREGTVNNPAFSAL